MYERESRHEEEPVSRSTEGHLTKWGLLGVGLAVGFLGMNLFVTRPLTARIERLETELATVETGMQDLVGVRDEVWQTSNLLSSLKAQRQQVAEANQALKDMREFREQFITEAGYTQAAADSLAGMVALPGRRTRHGSYRWRHWRVRYSRRPLLPGYWTRQG